MHSIAYRGLEIVLFLFLWVVIVELGIAITQSSSVKPDAFILDPGGYQTLIKYWMAVAFALCSTLAGVVARCCAVHLRHQRSIIDEPRLIWAAIRNGVLVGGLASATLAAVVAIMGTVAMDEKSPQLVSGSDRLTEIAVLAITLISFVYLAAYLAARDQIVREP